MEIFFEERKIRFCTFHVMEFDIFHIFIFLLKNDDNLMLLIRCQLYFEEAQKKKHNNIDVAVDTQTEQSVSQSVRHVI